jgi:hypothetical protein
MTISFECPNCLAPQQAEGTDGGRPFQCPACSHTSGLRANAFDGRSIAYCPVCATADMYVQKDFPHRIGLTIVLVGSLLSCVAWYHYKYPLALGILLVTAFLDLCLYYAIGDVLVCYRCLAQIRGAERRPEHRAFDLGIGERYRQERIRLEMLRKTGSRSAEPSGSST